MTGDPDNSSAVSEDVRLGGHHAPSSVVSTKPIDHPHRGAVQHRGVVVGLFVVGRSAGRWPDD